MTRPISFAPLMTCPIFFAPPLTQKLKVPPNGLPPTPVTRFVIKKYLFCRYQMCYMTLLKKTYIFEPSLGDRDLSLQQHACFL